MKASGGKARGGDSSKAKSEAMSNPKERHSLEASRTVASAASPASAKRVFMKRRKVSASTERESVRVEEAKDGAPKKEPVSESPLGEGRTEPGASREFQARGGKQLEKAVFVRNLPFDATPQAVSGILSRFGKVEEVFLVRNDAGECKGTAFVYFESEESVKRATEVSAAYAKQLEVLSSRQRKKISHLLSNNSKQQLQQLLREDDAGAALAAHSSALFLNGRRLTLLSAVKRSEAQRLSQSHSRVRAVEASKKRGLGIAFCGLLRPGKKGFDSLSEAEKRVATAAFEETRAKLKNPNFFVNKSRICLRNLPKWIDANFLRERMTLLLARIFRRQILSPIAATQAAAAAAAAESRLGEEKSCLDFDEEALSSFPSPREEGEPSFKKKEKRGDLPQPSLKQLKARAANAIEKVVVAREKRKAGVSSSKAASNGSAEKDSPRKALGFAFVSLKTDFIDTLQLLFALRDALGFFSKRVAFAESARALPFSCGGEAGSDLRHRVEAALAKAFEEGDRDALRRPLVQFALEDARKVKVMKERVAAFADLLKKREAETNEETAGAPKRRLKRKTYSRGQRQREKRRRLRLEAEQQQKHEDVSQSNQSNRPNQQRQSQHRAQEKRRAAVECFRAEGNDTSSKTSIHEAAIGHTGKTKQSNASVPSRRERRKNRGIEAKHDERRDLLEEEELRKKVQHLLLQRG